MKPIDKSKKSNIRCEHCENYANWPIEKCKLSHEDKKYWQRCKSFAWRKNKTYKEEQS